MYFFKCLLLFYLSNLSSVRSLQCMDQNNQPVDWFTVYKLPKEKHSDQLISEGVAYVYITSNDYSKWAYSNVGINDSRSIVSYSLSGLFDKKEAPSYILYNDQPPYGNKNSEKGHTKGVVLADQNGGIWLIHSVPHFPYSLDKFSYPTTGVHFGQSFLCISMDLGNLNVVGLQLQYNEPKIFAQNIALNLQNSVPELVKAAQNIINKNSPWYNVKELTSKGGVSFTSFAKSSKFGKDLYADLVAPLLQADLYVETWPNEANRLPSDCTNKFQVDNVLSLTISTPKLGFNSTKDHSKWAVSQTKDQEYWICIGDINRAQSQTVRGGGTTCLKNRKVATLYQDTVQFVQECSQEKLISNYIF